MEAEYIIRKEDLNTYLVSKWEGGDQPSAVYRIYITKDGLKCNCKSSKSCKHINMLREALKRKDENVI